MTTKGETLNEQMKHWVKPSYAVKDSPLFTDRQTKELKKHINLQLIEIMGKLVGSIDNPRIRKIIKQEMSL